jgi:hypothetical protein
MLVLLLEFLKFDFFLTIKQTKILDYFKVKLTRFSVLISKES